MIFRKAKQSRVESQMDRRERAPAGWIPQGSQAPPESGGPGAAPNRRGPYDSSEVDLDARRAGRIDLGGLQLRPRSDLELQLHVHEESQTVLAAMLINQQTQSMMELAAFAAPRSHGIWDEIRQEIVAETSKHGGLVSERPGPYGPELHLSVPVETPDGGHGTQTSRMIGVDGPRWFVRASLYGNAAQDQAAAAPFLAALAEVVVVRGKAPMAPRDLIPLSIPSTPASG